MIWHAGVRSTYSTSFYGNDRRHAYDVHQRESIQIPPAPSAHTLTHTPFQQLALASLSTLKSKKSNSSKIMTMSDKLTSQLKAVQNKAEMYRTERATAAPTSRALLDIAYSATSAHERGKRVMDLVAADTATSTSGVWTRFQQLTDGATEVTTETLFAAMLGYAQEIGASTSLRSWVSRLKSFVITSRMGDGWPIQTADEERMYSRVLKFIETALPARPTNRIVAMDFTFFEWERKLLQICFPTHPTSDHDSSYHWLNVQLFTMMKIMQRLSMRCADVTGLCTGDISMRPYVLDKSKPAEITTMVRANAVYVKNSRRTTNGIQYHAFDDTNGCKLSVLLQYYTCIMEMNLDEDGKSAKLLFPYFKNANKDNPLLHTRWKTSTFQQNVQRMFTSAGITDKFHTRMLRRGGTAELLRQGGKDGASEVVHNGVWRDVSMPELYGKEGMRELETNVSAALAISRSAQLSTYYSATE